MSNSDSLISLVPLTDVDSIMNWRHEVLRHVFGEEPTDEVMANNHSYFRRHLPDRSFWFVEAAYDGTLAGCGGICLYEELPSPDNPLGLCGYLMNIYVRQPCRRRGVADAIISVLIEIARCRNCDKVYLETTEEARQVYHNHGFRQMKDMMKLPNSL